MNGKCSLNSLLISSLDIHVEETEALFGLSGGDARKLLNIIEIVISSYNQGETILFNNDEVQKRLQKNIVLYDKNGEQHYDIISAFIKSIRGSDPNGAVYWLARMISAGGSLVYCPQDGYPGFGRRRIGKPQCFLDGQRLF